MKPITPRLAALFILLLATQPALAEIYRWVDEQGNVQFTQFPPSVGIEATTVNPRIAPAPERTTQETGELAEESPVSDDESKGSFPQPDPKTDRERAELEQRNCAAAKKNFATYQHARRVRLPDGTVEVMDDELRRKKQAEAQEQIEKYCR